MRTKRLLGLVVAAVAMAPVATFAQNRDRAPAREAARDRDSGKDEAAKALEREYGRDFQVRITGDHELNGVRVYSAEVVHGGQALPASVTGAGELIETGLPASLHSVPPVVRDVTDTLFHSPPAEVEAIDSHYFFVHLAARGSRPYTVLVDAAGRVIQIQSPLELRVLDPKNAEPAPGNERGRLEKLVHEHFGKVDLQDVRMSPDNPGFYNAYFTNADGPGMVTIDDRNEIVMFRRPAPIDKFPRAVQATLTPMLRDNKILNSGVGTERLFRVTENVAGDQFTLVIHSNGNINRIGEREGSAITASHRMPGR